MEIKNSLMPMQANQAQTQALALPKRAKSPSEQGTGFNQELQQAGATAVASSMVPIATPIVIVPEQSQQQSLNPGPEGKVGILGKSSEYSALGAKGIQPQAFGLREGPESAERNPETRSVAAGMNTAAAMSGLKSWNKDWIFGDQENNPALKPLIGGVGGAGTEKLDPAILAKLVEKLKTTPQQSKLTEQAGLEAAFAEAGTRGIAVGGGARAGAAFATDASGEIQQAPMPQFQPQSMGAGAEHVFDPSALGPMLAALQGSELREGGEDSALEPAGMEGTQPSAPKAQRLNAELGGADFLSTLGVANAASRGNQSELSGGDQQSAGRGRPDLKMIDGGGPVAGRRFDLTQLDPATGGLAGAQVMNFRPDGLATPKLVAPVVTGHVVKGAMSQDRLSSESLMGMTSGIQDLKAQGGGEMRVRLKPDGLGEMSVRVLTRGNDVRLQIRASDDGAKKIIEESMVHLKDRLATQNLTLGRVELSVGQLLTQQAAAGGHDGQPDSRQQSQWNQTANGQDWANSLQNQTSQGSQQSQQGGGNAERWAEAGSESAGRGASRGQSSSQAALTAMGAAGAARPRAYSETGRLDVTA